MNIFRKLITARRLSLGLILFLAGMMYVSTLVPQEMGSSPEGIAEWRHKHEALLWLVDGFKLYRMYVQPWFAAAILLALAALVITTFDQIAAARRKLYSTGCGVEDPVVEASSEQALRSVARSRWYLSLHTGSQDKLKFVRNPWGYFGNTLLHLGMVLVVSASLYVAVTGRQGVLIMIEGETRGTPLHWDLSEYGILASPLVLPGTVRLDKVRVNFDGKNRPAAVSSDVTITDGSGSAESFSASINKIIRYRGLRVYHAAQYGDAFSLEFSDGEGRRHLEKIPVQQSTGLDNAGYGDFDLTWSPHVLSTKYYADADRKKMTGGKPQLVVRLLDKSRELARASLTPGNSGILGNYRVRLLGVEKWAKLIFVDIGGMAVIFAGFGIIMIGGVVQYTVPPRELIAIRQQDGRYLVYWRAAAFKEFYMDERDSITRELQKEAAS